MTAHHRAARPLPGNAAGTRLIRLRRLLVPEEAASRNAGFFH